MAAVVAIAIIIGLKSSDSDDMRSDTEHLADRPPGDPMIRSIQGFF